MSDPDLYSNDPYRRFVAREKEKLRQAGKRREREWRKRKNSSFNLNSGGSNSDFSKQFNIDKDASKFVAALIGIPLVGMVMAVTVALVAVYGFTKITYKAILICLDKKDGLDKSSTKNKIKAGFLTAGFFSIASAVGLSIHEHNEIHEHNKTQSKNLPSLILPDEKIVKYPGITVAFNKGIRAFTYVGAYSDPADLVLRQCRRNSSSLFGCQVRGMVKAGKPMCIDFGGVASFKRFTNSKGWQDTKLSKVEYFIEYTDDKNSPNQATQQCLSTKKYSSKDCNKQTYFKRVCNF